MNVYKLALNPDKRGVEVSRLASGWRKAQIFSLVSPPVDFQLPLSYNALLNTSKKKNQLQLTNLMRISNHGRGYVFSRAMAVQNQCTKSPAFVVAGDTYLAVVATTPCVLLPPSYDEIVNVSRS